MLMQRISLTSDWGRDMQQTKDAAEAAPEKITDPLF
jgi:hypothetical protein